MRDVTSDKREWKRTSSRMEMKFAHITNDLRMSCKKVASIWCNDTLFSLQRNKRAYNFLTMCTKWYHKREKSEQKVPRSKCNWLHCCTLTAFSVCFCCYFCYLSSKTVFFWICFIFMAVMINKKTSVQEPTATAKWCQRKDCKFNITFSIWTCFFRLWWLLSSVDTRKKYIPIS